ncbi:MAG: hypothetical protein M5U34_25070 [Chloroflexi bacterium]|nr:hypothetical protein [Chloroflexota bacterium]
MTQLGRHDWLHQLRHPTLCASCSRARLTADGRLRLCLLREKEVNLMDPLRRAPATTTSKPSCVKASTGNRGATN